MEQASCLSLIQAIPIPLYSVSQIDGVQQSVEAIHELPLQHRY